MASPLIEPATPAELANRRQVLEIKDIVGSFPRLVEIVETDVAGLSLVGHAAKWRQFPVQIKLRFGWTDERQELAFVQGTVGARIVARCQRCLEPFEYELQASPGWLLVPPGTGHGDDTERESWELDDETVRPIDIVEETLIMALPMAAKHADRKDCVSIVSEEPMDRSNKVRPFATLKSQMQDLK
jgi:uncharacterized metal-binding protein YceD (DUF177 family)